MKLCIDPGHGDSNSSPGVFDSGAEGGNLREADIAWQFANTLAYLCKQAKIATYLTRSQDSPAPLSRRVQGAVDAHCTHWLSIHLNSADSSIARGYEVLIRDRKVSGKWAAVVLDAAGAMYGPSDKLNRGIKSESASPHGRLAVMGFTTHGPTCLVELGFITNQGDRAVLTTKEARVAFADRIIAYLKSL